MASVEELDFFLGEALGNLMFAVGQVRALDLPASKDHLFCIGRAVNQLWMVREALHAARPDMEPAYAREMREDRARYDELMQLCEKAGTAEENQDAESAHALYRELSTCAGRGWFVMIGEAGMYRTSAEGRAQRPAGAGE